MTLLRQETNHTDSYLANVQECILDFENFATRKCRPKRFARNKGGVYMHYENGFENLWGRYVRRLFGLEISFVRKLLGQPGRP